MPFVRNAVRPVHVRRGALARAGVTLGGEHEAAVNGSLARAMEQIADLSLIADRLFRELMLECMAALDRAERLSCKTRRLQDVADRLELAADDGGAKHESDSGGSQWTDCGTVAAIAYEQETGLFTPATRPECVVHLYRSLSVQQPTAGTGAECSASFRDEYATAIAERPLGFGQHDVPDTGGDNAATSLGRISMQPVFVKGGPTVVERDHSKAAARLLLPHVPRRRTLDLQPITRARCQVSCEPAVLASEEQLRRCTLPTPEQRQAKAIGLLPAPEVVAIGISQSAACGSMQPHRSKMAQLRGRQGDLLWLPVSKEGWHYQTLPARRRQAVDSGALHDQAGHTQLQKQQLPSLLGFADSLRIPPLASLRGVNLQPSVMVIAKDPSAYLYDTDADSSADARRDRTSPSHQQQRLADGRDGRAGRSHSRSRSSMRRSQLIGRLRRSLSLPKGFERRARSPSRHQRDVGSAAAMTASDFAGRSRADAKWQAVSAPAPSALIDDRSELVYVNFYGSPNTDAAHSTGTLHSRSSIRHSHSEHGRLGHGRPSMSESISAAASDCHSSLLQGLQLRSRSHGQIDQCYVGGVSGSGPPRSCSGAKGSILSKGLRPKSLSADRLHGLHVAPGASTRGSGGGGSNKLGGGASRLSRTLSGFFRRKQATSAAPVPSKQPQHGSHGGLPASVSAVVSYDDESGGKGKSKSRNRLSQLLAGIGIAGNGTGGGVLLRKRDSKATSSSSGRWSGSERYSVGSDAGGGCQATTTLSQSRLSKLSGDRDSAVSEGSLPRGDHPFDVLSFGSVPAAAVTGECPSLGTFSPANRSSCADFNLGVSGHVQSSSQQQQPAAHSPDVLCAATPIAVQLLPATTSRSTDVASRCCCCCCGASSDVAPESPLATYLGLCPDCASDEDWSRCVAACDDAQSPADGCCYREAWPAVVCDRPSHIVNYTRQSSSPFSHNASLSRSARAARPPQQQSATRASRESAAADGYCTLPRPGRFRFAPDVCKGNGDVSADSSITGGSEVTGDRGVHDYRSLPRHLSANRVVQFGATKGDNGVVHGHGPPQQRQLNAQGINAAQAPDIAVTAHVSNAAAAVQSPADTAAGSGSRFLESSETALIDEDDSGGATTAAPPDVPAMPEVVPPPVLCSLVNPLGQSRCHELRRASYRRSLSPGTLETSVMTRLPAGDSALVSSLIQEARSMSAAAAASSTAMSPTSPQTLAAAVEPPSHCGISVQHEHHPEAGVGCFVRRASYRVAVTKVQNAASGVQQCCSGSAAGGSSADMGSSLAVSNSKRSSLIASRVTDDPAAVDTSSDFAAEEFPVDGVFPAGLPCDDCDDTAAGSNSFIRSYSYRLANRSSARQRKRVVAPTLPPLTARRSLLLFETDREQSPSPDATAAGREMRRVSADAQNSLAHFAACSPSVVTAAATTTTTTLDWSMLPSNESGAGSGDACLEIACRVRFTGRLGSAFSATGISSSLSHLNALVSADRAKVGMDESSRASRLSSSAIGAAAAASPTRTARERPRSTFFPKGDVSTEIMHGLLALQHHCHDGAAAAAFTSLEMLRQDERMLLSLMDVVTTSPPSPGISSDDLSASESDPAG